MAIIETELTQGVVVPEAVQPVETFTIPDWTHFKNMAEYAQNRVAARLGIYPDDPAKAATMCISYAKSIDIEVSDDSKKRIIAQAKEAELIPDPARRLMRLSVVLRQEGVRLPLKMTLLIKNLYFLDRMAKKAGMIGIEGTNKY